MAPAIKILLVFAALLQTPTATGVRVTGRVVDGETGAGIPEAIVTLMPSVPGSQSFPLSAEAKTTAKGTFQFLNVPPGAYELKTQHPKPTTAYRSESLDIGVGNRDVSEVGLILSPAVSKVAISGKIALAGSARLPASLSAIHFSTEVVPVASDGSFQGRIRPFEKYGIAVPSADERYYVTSISAGEWDRVAETWMIRERPSAPVQITLAVGRQRATGRILTFSGTPATSGAVSLRGPAPSMKSSELTPGEGGAFSLTGLRSGDYELRAQTGAGDTLQAASLKFTIENQNREGLELRLKVLSPIRGQVVVTGRSLQDLMAFKPVAEIEDASGKRVVPVDSRGMFDFKSFDGEFTVSIRDLPVEFRVQSITLGPSSVTVRVTSLPGDVPRF